MSQKPGHGDYRPTTPALVAEGRAPTRDAKALSAAQAAIERVRGKDGGAAPKPKPEPKPRPAAKPKPTPAAKPAPRPPVSPQPAETAPVTTPAADIPATKDA